MGSPALPVPPHASLQRQHTAISFVEEKQKPNKFPTSKLPGFGGNHKLSRAERTQRREEFAESEAAQVFAAQARAIKRQLETNHSELLAWPHRQPWPRMLGQRHSAMS